MTGYSALDSVVVSNAATLFVVLKPWGERENPEQHQQAVLARLQPQLLALPSALVMAFAPPPIPGVGNVSGLDSRLLDYGGRPAEELAGVARTIVTAANARPEIARAYTALPQAPRRSVLFLAVTAEEQGLLGSAYYAKNPIFPLAQTVGGLNMDGMNNFGATRDITVVGLGMSDLDAYLQAAAAAQERVLEGDRESEKGFYYRSDHFELAKEGVPMLYPGGGYDDREKGVAYGMEKSLEYNRDHYHRVSDEYDLSWNVDGALEDMDVFFRTGLDVANSDDWPNWKEGTEFKAKRDAQRP